jgi:hypothetical protein
MRMRPSRTQASAAPGRCGPVRGVADASCAQGSSRSLPALFPTQGRRRPRHLDCATSFAPMATTLATCLHLLPLPLPLDLPLDLDLPLPPPLPLPLLPVLQVLRYLANLSKRATPVPRHCLADGAQSQEAFASPEAKTARATANACGRRPVGSGAPTPVARPSQVTIEARAALCFWLF